jgi:dienelactone hydrolase
MKHVLLLLIFLPSLVFAQQTVTFTTTDGLTVTASLYLKDKTLPFVIAFHQASYSRGEYSETAPRLLKLGFNCLAVDLRSGNECNYIQNLTAANATQKKIASSFADAEKDILAAIAYVHTINKQNIILLGSSYSASLVLKVAKNNPLIEAVAAFSPGEYLQPKIALQPLMKQMDKTLFIGCTKTEEPYIREMLKDVHKHLITWWKPYKNPGIQGSRMLWKDSPESDNCWMALMLWLKNLKSHYPERSF